MKKLRLFEISSLILSAALIFSACGSSLGDGTSAELSGGIVINGNIKDTSSDTDINSQAKASSESGRSPAGSSSAAEKAPSKTENNAGSDEIKNVKNTIRSQAKALKLTEPVLSRAVVNKGDTGRISSVIKKASRGEAVTIGFIGGSITAGSGASSSSKSYAGAFERFWRETFPKSRLTVVNAGIGATDSLIGVHRVENDLLKYKPDLVVVEFSVNDNASSAALFRESYESLVRRILKSDKSPAVLLLFMVEKSGASMQSVHSQIGRHYNLPMISYKDAISSQDGSQLFPWQQISSDDVHPNDMGHAIVSELLAYYINCVRAETESAPEPQKTIPAPLTASSYENARLLTNRDLAPESFGSFKAGGAGVGTFQNGWTASGGTDPAVFKITAKRVYILYKMDKSTGKGGSATVTVDSGKQEILNSDASSSWGDHAVYDKLFDGSSAAHEIKITPSPSGGKTDFTILGFLAS